MMKCNDSNSNDSSVAQIALGDERMRLMLDSVPAMITYVDAGQRYKFCNRAYLAMLEKDASEVLERTQEEVLGKEVFAVIRPFAERVLAGETVGYERSHFRGANGERQLSVTFTPHFSAQGKVVGFVCLTLDVTDANAMARRLAHAAAHDPLTGLPNRALYEDRLACSIASHRRGSTAFALLYLDLDRFKVVNDSHGHAAGDELLMQFATRLRSALREVDTAARLGGDEFAVILQGPISQVEAAVVAQKIVRLTQEPFALRQTTVEIGVSIGLAVADQEPISARELERRADAALYRAKSVGRGTFVLYPQACSLVPEPEGAARRLDSEARI